MMNDREKHAIRIVSINGSQRDIRTNRSLSYPWIQASINHSYHTSHNPELVIWPIFRTKDLRQLEERFVNCAEHYCDKCELDGLNVKAEDFLKNLLYRYPSLFYLSNRYYRHLSLDGRHATWIVQYDYSKREASYLRMRLDEAIHELVSDALHEPNSFLRLKKVYEWFCKTVAYDNSHRIECFNAIGPMCEHKGVCSGIAKAFMIVCIRLGIPCGIVEGSHGFGKAFDHCWNIVRINNATYHIDVVCGISFFKGTKAVSYAYFMVPRSGLNLSRSIDKSYIEIESREYMYARVVGQYFNGITDLSAWMKEISKLGFYTLSGEKGNWRNGKEFANDVLRIASTVYAGRIIHVYPCVHLTTVLHIPE